MKKKVVTTRSVRLYIPYINDFAILDAIIDSSDYWYWVQQILLLIPADAVIDSSRWYYYWFKQMLLLISADVSIVDFNKCANIIFSNGCFYGSEH